MTVQLITTVMEKVDTTGYMAEKYMYDDFIA